MALKKELGLLDVYAIAMGTTISGGFFLLPGLAYAVAGPAVIISYLVAAVLVVPAMFSMVELTTAMPRAGGAYYFLDRAMGPLMGSIGGLGTYVVLVLKTAFALIGIGAYLSLFFPDLPIIPVALVLALAFGGLNLAGAKKTGSFQVILVVILLIIVAWFMGDGLFSIRASHFGAFFDAGADAIFATAGLVYISYAGLTKITSVAEEVQDPERNLPLGMFLALGTATLIYGLGTYVMVGIIPPATLGADLTPAASAAEGFSGPVGKIVISIGAFLSFFAAANAGVLSASRYPMAMGRDRLLPTGLGRTNEGGIPDRAIYLTTALLVLVILTLDPLKIAKLASAFQLLMFAGVCLAVIVMRESRILAYDPGYKSPLYPWMQYLGIIAAVVLIGQMGLLSISFSLGLVGLSIVWYNLYAKEKVERGGAILHWFARLGQHRYDPLEAELRGILKEKGVRESDLFESVVAKSVVIDIDKRCTYHELVQEVSRRLGPLIALTQKEIFDLFIEGNERGATPVTAGIAMPHFRTRQVDVPIMAFVRARKGVDDLEEEVIEGTSVPHRIDEIHAVFFLVSPDDDPGQHLRILAKIAGRVEESDFFEAWTSARDEQELKEVLLRDDRFMSVVVADTGGTASLIGNTLRDAQLPVGSLVTLIRRGRQIVVPKGSTTLMHGDRLTIIGDPASLRQLKERFDA